MQELRVKTERRSQLVDITRQVEAALGELNGATAALVYVPHTTAGVTINEHADPAVARDFEAALERIVSEDWPWQHVEEGEENAPTHIRAAFMGSDVLVPMRDGRLALGTWQGIFLCEFDGPRERSVYVTALDLIEVAHLSKRYGKVLAVDDLSLPRRARPRHRLPRAERRRQDDDAARHSLGARPSDARRRDRPRRAATPSSGPPIARSARSSRRTPFHPGRTGRNHLRVLAAAAGIAAARVEEVLALVDLTGGREAPCEAATRSACGSGSALARRCSATREVLVLDEPANGLDPQGIRWLRDLLRSLAPRGARCSSRATCSPRSRRSSTTS